jgi:hypothetical protein
MDLTRATATLNAVERSQGLDPTTLCALLSDVAVSLLENPETIQARIAAVETWNDKEILSIREFLSNLAKELTRAEKPEPVNVSEPDRLLDAVAPYFFRHWFGQSVIALIILALALLGIGVGTIGIQAASALKTKDEALAAVRDTKLTADQAKADAEQTKSELVRTLSDTQGMRLAAVDKAAEDIAKDPNITKAVQAAIDETKRQLNDRLNERLNDVEGRMKSVDAATMDARKNLASVMKDYTEIENARSKAILLGKEVQAVERIIDARKETLGSSAFVSIIWSTVRYGSAIMILALAFSIVALGIALRRPRPRI